VEIEPEDLDPTLGGDGGDVGAKALAIFNTNSNA
jgi:hypothetical protein